MSIQQETTELDQIITLLGDSDLANAAEITKQIAVPREQLEPFMFWNEGEYTRNCLARGNNYELLLLCWSEGQKTAIHCHDGQECWVKVISGSFKECIYRFDEESLKLSMLSTEVIGNNETTIMVDGSLYHSLENTNSGRAVSLHLYMNPIDKCTVYDANQNCFVEKKLAYYSERGVICG